MTPFISIITPTLNSERFIRDNLNSLRRQSYRQFEHLIIDGGSTDQTLAMIKDGAPEARIISEPDQGISDAFNKGIRFANGAIIGILNADDYYADDVLRDVADRYRDSACDFILHGDVRIFTEHTNYYFKPRPFPKLFFYLDLPYHHPSVFTPKNICDDVGEFALCYQVAMDYDFLLRARLKGYQFRYLPRLVTHFRWGGAANRHAVQCHHEVLHSQLQHGLSPVICYLTFGAKLTINYLKRLVRRCSTLHNRGKNAL